MILDGKIVSEQILNKIKNDIVNLQVKPKVVSIVTLNSEPNKLYVKNKSEACRKVGVDFELKIFDENVNEEEIINYINKLNNDDTVHAIMFQLPMPKSIDSNKIINTITSNKDVDGLTYYNKAKLYDNNYDLIPCTSKGIIKLLDFYDISLENKEVVIIGRGDLVGRPLIHLLLSKDANVTICHSKTINLSQYTQRADVVICATDKINLITKEMLKKDCTIIDAGISFKNGKLYGNVNKEVINNVKYITPVPGGVGPMTVAMFLENILICYKKQ